MSRLPAKSCDDIAKKYSVPGSSGSITVRCALVNRVSIKLLSSASMDVPYNTRVSEASSVFHVIVMLVSVTRSTAGVSVSIGGDVSCDEVPTAVVNADTTLTEIWSVSTWLSMAPTAHVYVVSGDSLPRGVRYSLCSVISSPNRMTTSIDVRKSRRLSGQFAPSNGPSEPAERWTVYAFASLTSSQSRTGSRSTPKELFDGLTSTGG